MKRGETTEEVFRNVSKSSCHRVTPSTFPSPRTNLLREMFRSLVGTRLSLARLVHLGALPARQPAESCLFCLCHLVLGLGLRSAKQSDCCSLEGDGAGEEMKHCEMNVL